MYFLIGSDGVEYGPVDAARIREWITQNRVDARTRIRAAAGGEWTTVGQSPEFQAAGGPPPPVPPPTRPRMTPPPVPSSAPGPKLSGLAIASIVLGICGFCLPILSPLTGLILGLVALRRIRRSGGHQVGKGLAVTGIVLSLVTLLVGAVVLGSLAYRLHQGGFRTGNPAWPPAAASSPDTRNDLKQLALGALLYAGDHEGRLPPAATWCDVLQQGGLTPREFLKTGAPATARCSYGFNERLGGRAVKSGDVVLLFELDEPGWNVNGGPSLMRIPRGQRDQVTVAFADGSVRVIPTAEMNTLRWDP